MLSSLQVRFLSTIVVLVMLVSGCSSGGSTSASSGGDSLAGAAQATAGPASPVVGQIYLGKPGGAQVAGVRVEARDTSAHQALASTSTDATGLFRFGDVPADCTFVAHLAGGVTLQARRDGTGWQWVSPGTTLLFRYMSTHPGVSSSTASARVRAYFGVPASVDLARGLEDTWRSPFSWSVFVKAAGATPVDAFIDQQVAKIGTGTATFRLPHPYAKLYRALHGDPFATTSARKSAQLLEDGAVSFLGAVGTNIIEGGIALSAINTAAGWASEAAGLGLFGNDTALQLQDILQDLNAMDVQLTQSTTFQSYLTAQTAANTAAQNIQANYTTWSNDLNPSAPDPQEAATTLNTYVQVDSPKLSSDLGTLSTFLVGNAQSSPMVSVYAGYLQSTYGNLNPTGTNQFFDLRSNALVDQLQAQVDYYAGFLTIGATLYAEWGHLDPNTFSVVATSSNANAFATNTLQAASQLQAVTQTMVEAQQLVPPGLPSDDVLVDCSAQRMWYLQAQAVVSNTQASSTAFAFSLPGIAGAGQWRLPTESEAATLRGYALSAGGQDVNSGLTAMGFSNVPASGSKFVVFVSSTTNVTGAQPYDMTTGKTDNEPDCQLLLVRACPGATTPTIAYQEQDGVLLETTTTNRTTLVYNGVETPAVVPAVLPAGAIGIVLPPANPLDILATYVFVADNVGVEEQLSPHPGASYDYASWTSSNPAGVSVYNLPPSNVGSYQFHATSPPSGTITASWCWSLGGGTPTSGVIMRNLLTATIPFSQLPAPTSNPHVLKAVFVTPQGSTLGQAALHGFPAAAQVYCFATAIYADQTLEDVTGQVSWTVDNAGATFAAGGAAGQKDNNLLTVPQTIGSATLTITATLPGGGTGTGTLSTTFVP